MAIKRKDDTILIDHIGSDYVGIIYKNEYFELPLVVMSMLYDLHRNGKHSNGKTLDLRNLDIEGLTDAVDLREWAE